MNEAEPAVPGAGTNDRWRLDGRVVLVTGASAGLGARFARVLHTAGAHVIATARRADLLEELVQHCGNRIQTIVGDIADPHHRQAVIEMIRPHGQLDVMVNNAGICDDGPLEQQALDDLRMDRSMIRRPQCEAAASAAGGCVGRLGRASRTTADSTASWSRGDPDAASNPVPSGLARRVGQAANPPSTVIAVPVT